MNSNARCNHSSIISKRMQHYEIVTGLKTNETITPKLKNIKVQ